MSSASRISFTVSYTVLIVVSFDPRSAIVFDFQSTTSSFFGG
jgi:hypothetical protein